MKLFRKITLLVAGFTRTRNLKSSISNLKGKIIYHKYTITFDIIIETMSTNLGEKNQNSQEGNKSSIEKVRKLNKSHTFCTRASVKERAEHTFK